MCDLNVTFSPETKSAQPTINDKRLIDNIKFIPAMADEPLKEVIKEVFDEPKLEVKPVISDKVVFGSDEELPSPVKKVKESSSKQRDHLKKAREKALETRRAKAKERKIVEDEKKALRQQKREEKEKLMIEKEDKEHAKEVKNIEVKPHSYMKEFTQEQLIELQQKAIENYEVKRKATKKIKKEQIAKDTADKKVYESITKAIGPVQAQDPWADCFR